MRRRLHYTPNQITNNLYTTGSEWMTETGVEYIGPYHTYTTDETFTEASWNPNTSQKLIPFVSELTANHVYRQLKTIQTKFTAPTVYYPVITESDRKFGFITRYFLKCVNQNFFIEINEQQYTDWTINKIDANLYTAGQLTWKITGNLKTETVNGVAIPGVTEHNINAIAQLEFNMPGISLILSNPTQYYTDIDFIAPKDINA